MILWWQFISSENYPVHWYSSLDLSHQNYAAKFVKTILYLVWDYRNPNWTNAKVIDVKVSRAETPTTERNVLGSREIYFNWQEVRIKRQEYFDLHFQLYPELTDNQRCLYSGMASHHCHPGSHLKSQHLPAGKLLFCPDVLPGKYKYKEYFMRSVKRNKIMIITSWYSDLTVSCLWPCFKKIFFSQSCRPSWLPLTTTLPSYSPCGTTFSPGKGK